MPVSEPSRHWQIQKHQQIVNRDSPTAFAQLSEVALPHLIAFLKQQFHQVEEQLCETAAIDCLLTYYAAPDKYLSEKLTLFAYLRMAARHDLLNALDRSRRKNHPLVPLDDPAVQTKLLAEDWPESGSSLLDNWFTNGDDHSQQSLLRSFENELNSTDRQLFLLMLNGVRDSAPYAEIMALDNLPAVDQRREVKRAKDRLTKKLSRFISHHKKQKT